NNPMASFPQASHQSAHLMPAGSARDHLQTSPTMTISATPCQHARNNVSIHSEDMCALISAPLAWEESRRSAATQPVLLLSGLLCPQDRPQRASASLPGSSPRIRPPTL